MEENFWGLCFPRDGGGVLLTVWLKNKLGNKNREFFAVVEHQIEWHVDLKKKLFIDELMAA